MFISSFYLLCDPSCPGGTGTIPQNYQIRCEKPQRKRFGSDFFGLIHNDAEITDLSDLTAVQTAKEAGLIGLSPCGKFNIGVPSNNTSTDLSYCRDEEVIETVYNPTFQTYDLDCENFQHCTYFSDMIDISACSQLFWFDCKKDLVWCFNLTTGGATTIGFPFSVTNTPHPEEGDNGWDKWVMGFQFKVPGNFVICPKLIPGLTDILTA